MTPDTDKDRLIDKVIKIVNGIGRTLDDPSVPDFDKELLKAYLKEWFK